MFNMKKIFLFLLTLNIALPSIAQKQGQELIDSLLLIIPKQNEDTNKIKILNELSFTFSSINPDMGMKYGQEALKLAQTKHWKKGIANAYSRIGVNYSAIANQPLALENHLKSLRINEELGYKKAIAGNLNNIGNVYLNTLNYSLALTYYLKALKMNEELGNKKWISLNYGNIGNIFWKQLKYTQALNYYFKSVKLNEELGDVYGIGKNYSNIGNVYNDQNNFGKALDYYLKAITILKVFNNKLFMSQNYANIAGTYMNIYSDSTTISQNQKYNRGDKKLLYLSKNYVDSAVMIDLEFSLIDHLSKDYELFSNFNMLIGNNKEALIYYKKHTWLKDSIFNMEKENSLTQSAMQYEFDKKETIAKAEQEKKDIQHRNIRNTIAVVLIGVLLFLIIVFRQHNKVKKQKKEVENQKKLVDDKNKEILDSIHYAKRIQQAMLTSEQYIKKHFKAEYFIFYQPKDIVSGDFYWATAHHDKFYIATADCTGHGVPGAFMSLLNISFLNENVIERGIQSPAEIFNKQRKKIISALNPNGNENSKDGMDGVLCSFDLKNNKLEFTAANNPLWLIRNNKLIEFKGDKMPVGKGEDGAMDFSNQLIDLQKDDLIYTFTDGYADQFGGPNDRKFMYKQLGKLLLQICHLSMQQQHDLLSKTINAWKSTTEQVDDILVIGVKI